MENKVFIVIPVHNNIKYTVKCLDCLKEQTYRFYEVVVIDDGSSDDTSETIKKIYSHVTLLKGDGNLWWAGGTNLGVDYALSRASEKDFVLTLNNDLEVKKNYLQTLLDVYYKYEPCLVGSVSVNSNNKEKVEFLGLSWNKYTGKLRPKMDTSLPYSFLFDNDKVIDSDLLPGRGTLIPVKLFKKIGLFDQVHFPQYAADFDFSRRAVNEGYKLVVSSTSIVSSVVEVSGLKYKDNPNFQTFFKALFSMKSPIWYRIRYYWAIKHSPLKFLYFVISMLRIFFSFLIAKFNYSFLEKP